MVFGNEFLNFISKINIARLELSMKNFEKALLMLESINTNEVNPTVKILIGDALFGSQRYDLAKKLILKLLSFLKLMKRKQLLNQNLINLR